MQHSRKLLPFSFTKFPIRQRGVFILSIPFACLFASLLTFAALRSSMVGNDRDVQEAQQVQIETKQLLTALLNAEDNMQAFGLTRRQTFLDAYQDSLATITKSLEELEPLVQNNPEQQQRLQRVHESVDKGVLLLNQKITLQQNLQENQGEEELVVPIDLLYDWLEDGEATLDAAHNEINLFAQQEEHFLEERRQHQEAYRQITWVILCLMAVIGMVAGLLAMHLFRRLERELATQQVTLQKTNQQLELACDQLQRFTANASHELRAPLAAVLSTAQVGLMDPPEDLKSLRNRLAKIADLTKSMSTLVGNLLFLSRHEGSLQHEVLQSTDLVSLLKLLVDDWSEQVMAHNLQFSSQFPDEPVRVNGDPSLLKQATINLLSNACQYTPPGGSIQLKLFTQASQAVIEVQDNGIGIPEQDLPYIFERFYRVDKHRNRSKGQYGLGLAIAQQIVHAHLGKIAVTSHIGQGTTFQISLPLSQSTQKA